MRIAHPLLVLVTCLLVACSRAPSPRAEGPSSAASHGTEAAPPPESGTAEALFAGGCFWCMEGPFEALPGVLAVESGYTGGSEAHPTYEAVSARRTGHYESVRVVYDPARIDYARLLEVFFHNVDPTQSDGQFCDHGPQYRSAIFVHDARERALAEAAIARAHARLGRPIATAILDAGPFWLAEDYHQDFYRTNPVRYHAYREGCGRDARLREIWGEDAGH